MPEAGIATAVQCRPCQTRLLSINWLEGFISFCRDEMGSRGKVLDFFDSAIWVALLQRRVFCRTLWPRQNQLINS